MNRGWQRVVERLGWAEPLEIRARNTKALRRVCVIESAADPLRVDLSYCLCGRGLRSTAAWTAANGLVDISSVALLYRLRQCSRRLSRLVGQALVSAAPKASHGRMIRIIDARLIY